MSPNRFWYTVKPTISVTPTSIGELADRFLEKANIRATCVWGASISQIPRPGQFGSGWLPSMRVIDL